MSDELHVDVDGDAPQDGDSFDSEDEDDVSGEGSYDATGSGSEDDDDEFGPQAPPMIARAIVGARDGGGPARAMVGGKQGLRSSPVLVSPGATTGEGGDKVKWKMVERATTTYQGRSAMSGVDRSIRGAGQVDFSAPSKVEGQREPDTSWMPRQQDSGAPPRYTRGADGDERRSGPGVDAQEATREYLRNLAVERARRRAAKMGIVAEESEEEDYNTRAVDEFDRCSAAMAADYEKEARAKRESQVRWNAAKVWVDIIVEQAMLESGQRARAAARLQARIRGDQQRTESKRMRKAIIKVQSAARARQAQGVLQMLQGNRRKLERQSKEREQKREDNRERSEHERMDLLQDESSMRAQAGQQARTLKQNRAVAEELICMACDDDVGPLAQLLRETPFVEQAVNMTDSGGWTPLMWGASLGHPEICQLLLQAQASVQPHDSDGWDALMLATDRSHIEPAEMLLDASADPTLEARYGRSAMSIATAQGSQGLSMVALLGRPPPDQQLRPSSAPATPGQGMRSRGGSRSRSRPSTAGPGSSQAITRAASPTRMTGRKRPSTAARELQQAIDQMNQVGMHSIGSAGFSTIIQARNLGIDTVIEAMLAYAEHHGVQHFGVAALAEQHENAPGSLNPTNTLCSALLQASAAHPARQSDVVLPAMSLLAQTFLAPLGPFAADGNDAIETKEMLGSAVAAAFCVASTAVAMRVLLMHDIRAGNDVADLSDVPHTHIEDVLELIVLGLRCSAAGGDGPAADCCATMVEGGMVQPLVTIVHIYGHEQRDEVSFVRLAFSALCLISAPQPRYACEPFGFPTMPVLRRRRQLTLIRAEELAFCVEGPRGSGSGMHPYAVVWWEGERLGRTEAAMSTDAPAWGMTMQFTLPPEAASLRIEVFSEARKHSSSGEMEPEAADRLVGGVTLVLGSNDSPGSAEVILPPYIATLEVNAMPGSLSSTRPGSSNFKRPKSGKPKSKGGGLVAGSLLLSIDEQVGGLDLDDLVHPCSSDFAHALANADGLRALVHACPAVVGPPPAAEPSPAKLQVLKDDSGNREDVEDPAAEDVEDAEAVEEWQEPLTEEEEKAERQADALMLMDVLRMGASVAMCGAKAPLRRQLGASAAPDDDLEQVVDDLLVESGLLALARSTLLPAPDPDAAAERMAGKERLSDAILATLALRSTVCMAALLEIKLGMPLSLHQEGVQNIDGSGNGGAGLVLDAALAHAELAEQHCHPVLDAAWLLLRRLAENAEDGAGWAARATIQRVASPHNVRTGAMSLAAGETQARAVHCMHWLWHGGSAWDWATEEAIQQLVPAVLVLLEGGGAAVGQQQDEACRLVNLLLTSGPHSLRCMLLVEVGKGGGMLRLKELMDDGTKAMSWSKANAAAALQTAQRLCAPIPGESKEQLLALLQSDGGAGSGGAMAKKMLGNAAKLVEQGVNFVEHKTRFDLDGDGDVGEEKEQPQPVLDGLTVATQAGLLVELSPQAVAATLEALPGSWKKFQKTRKMSPKGRRDSITEEDGPTEPALLMLVLEPDMLDRPLIDCMAEMAYWRRSGEEVLAPQCGLGVLGLDGRGVGAQGTAVLHKTWRLLDIPRQILPALVLIKGRYVIERQTFGVIEQGACARGDKDAVSTALPPLTKESLQPAVEKMLRAAH